ncbi:MAG: ABC transporter ATP-binding protein [Eubacteriaceae bacterium]|jgi:ABC-2 type transport system ATP-binding protein|nr:ABC transporter ATP-binding protein [Eubacteriaceae bacterium]
MNNRIEIKKLTKHYETFFLDDVSFKVPKGYITGFIGPNGSGKTTTIKSILSLIHQYKGTILYNGQDICGENKSYVEDIGIVMDSTFLAKDWTIKNVERAMSVGYSNWDQHQFEDYLKVFEIDQTLKVKELSRGMNTKLMLAIAFSHQAKTLILDEPTSGLDPIIRDEFREILQAYVEDEEHTVLFSTHITQDLEAIADYIVFIQGGKIYFTGSVDDFLNRYVIVKAGLDEADTIEASAIIGSRQYHTRFEAMILREDLPKISDHWIVEKPTIDQIMVFHKRGNN